MNDKSSHGSVPHENYAFPFTHEHPDYWAHCTGMTLRDWFAGQVAAGMVANQRTAGGSGDIARTVADYSYAIADAMMRARDR